MHISVQDFSPVINLYNYYTPHSKLKSSESEISQKVVCLFTEELRRCTLWSPEYEVPRAEFHGTSHRICKNCFLLSPTKWYNLEAVENINSFTSSVYLYDCKIINHVTSINWKFCKKLIYIGINSSSFYSFVYKCVSFVFMVAMH